MTYTLKDVDYAEALVLAERPGTITMRSDYDWYLSIRDKDQDPRFAIILFKCADQYRPEIKSTPEQIRKACSKLDDDRRYETRLRHQDGYHPDERINLVEMFLGDVGIWDTVEKRWVKWVNGEWKIIDGERTWIDGEWVPE